MQVAFSDEFTYDRVGLLIVTVGMGFYLAAATLNQAALAQGQARRAAMCWIGCAIAYVAWNLLPVPRRLPPGRDRFALAAATLCGLFLLYRAPHPAGGGRRSTDSPQEIEAARRRRRGRAGKSRDVRRRADLRRRRPARGIAAAKVADRPGPGLLLFVALGMLVGSGRPRRCEFDDAELTRTLGTIGLVLILFEGGLSAGWGEIRR